MADLDLEEIKELHDKAYTHNQTTRISAADDRLFAYITQWDSSVLEDTQLGYKGEFNIIRKAVRDIMADLDSNPVQIDFEPKSQSRKGKDEANILNGIYLTRDRMNTSIEAKGNACQETVDCGIGGWELVTEYDSYRDGSKKQVIKRRPIYEFNNNAFPDPNAKLIDKSDARYWSILEPYTKEGYEDLHLELTGEETEVIPANFASPESSYVFPWVTGNELFYIVRFYHKQMVKDKILTMTDPMGQTIKLRESDLTLIMDELIEQGYEIVSEKKIKRWEVKCYIASGEKILKVSVIPGEKLPVIPMYGERAFVEGEEHYEGVIRLAKDPQRLRNFLMSYLGDMVARSPRSKPIFGAEQLAGFEYMYQINGADNNYPYLLQHLKDASGVALPMGPVGEIKPPELNGTMATLLEMTKGAVEDVANPGLPDDITDTDLSGSAIELIQSRMDQQSVLYRKNYKFAQRYDAEVFASMATVILDTPQTVTVTLPDGTRKQEEIMKQVVDGETGELVTLNDLTNMEFEVYAKLGRSYDSQEQKTREQLAEMAEAVRETDPVLHKALIYKIIELTNGVNMDDIKDYTRKQLILTGIKQPETDEEIAFAEQAANQPDAPDANMVLAMAEQGKAQAAQMREARLAELDKQNNANKDAEIQIKAYSAQTDREKLKVDAAQAGVNIRFTQEKIAGQRIQNARSVIEPFRARVN